MLPLVCNDAIAILFMFDLTRKSTLNSVKEWFRQSRGFNNVGRCSAFRMMKDKADGLLFVRLFLLQTAIPVLVS